MPKTADTLDLQKRDQDLLTRARAGDGAAVEALLEAYKPLVLSRASRYFLAHGDRDDLIQEGMIALFQAVAACPAERFTSFASYAFQAVDNRLVDLLRQEQSQKRQALAQALSLDAPSQDQADRQDLPLGVTIRLDQAGPDDQVLYQESLKALAQALEEDLSPQEGQVLQAYLQGQSYEAIGQALGLTSKSVDASLQRARRKLRKRFS